MTIDRRKFLAAGGLCLTGGTPIARAFSTLLLRTDSSPGRTIYSLNQGWLWSRETSTGAHQRDFDDSVFAQVTLPHSNVFVPWHSFDQANYQFVSTYRRHFKLSSRHKGQRVFVDFEAAATASKVWLNGALIGECFGGATAVWVRTTNVPGELILTASHAHFGERKVTIQSRPAPVPDI
jgi:beta-galactosidase